jgi:hypothetical protein
MISPTPKTTRPGAESVRFTFREGGLGRSNITRRNLISGSVAMGKF